MFSLWCRRFHVDVHVSMLMYTFPRWWRRFHVDVDVSTCSQRRVRAIRPAVLPHYRDVRGVSDTAGASGGPQRLQAGRVPLSLRHPGLQPHLRQLGLRRPRAEPVRSDQVRRPGIVHHARGMGGAEFHESANRALVFRSAVPAGWVMWCNLT